MSHEAPGQCSCGREWWAMGEAHCSSYHSHFTSDAAFDRHLAAPQSRDDCYDPKTLNDRRGRRVFKVTERASGPTWTTRSDEPHPFARIPGNAPVEQQGDVVRPRVEIGP